MLPELLNSVFNEIHTMICFKHKKGKGTLLSMHKGGMQQLPWRQTHTHIQRMTTVTQAHAPRFNNPLLTTKSLFVLAMKLPSLFTCPTSYDCGFSSPFAVGVAQVTGAASRTHGTRRMQHRLRRLGTVLQSPQGTQSQQLLSLYTKMSSYSLQHRYCLRQPGGCR